MKKSDMQQFCMRAFLITLLMCAGIITSAHAAGRAIAFIGDSIMSSYYSPPGYPALIGRILGAKIYNLTTLHFPPSFRTDQALHDEIPAIPAGTTDAFVAIGADDLIALATNQENLDTVEKTLDAIVQALQARHIRVYILTVRDFTQDPQWAPQLIPLGQLQSTISRVHKKCSQFDDFELTLTGVTTIDIRKIPALMAPEIYQGGGDGMHLTPTGLKVFADTLAPLLQR